MGLIVDENILKQLSALGAIKIMHSNNSNNLFVYTDESKPNCSSKSNSFIKATKY